ncbi:uncharacterized protein L3040_009439 [Drepanopeziza brunnea f. sp. 'multigermtubi']|uniref:RNase H type-1 domain-containing protein n=1 Tax=Marssonina brunnea f. sp. multigermtubi (strain MB_m1) TaxID=1072389 RepID=K1WV44_MARBU|nr:uncharacterized protein MBM_05621 [Drepanopeziza brunnea f. sp. 'multigermtubi' MB_m1]EKD16327.1 hypothetical protein MBM_05621 [Drepanopeziza brunnea f. sp. 'multigermtubi' MB_m1]KAJ5032848.1 hypothetical protein L3040_009439 [Drepanopeziza brunnea f. sp. 'multigermtubi']
MESRPNRIFNPTNARIIHDLKDDVCRLASSSSSSAVVIAVRARVRHSTAVTGAYGVSFKFDDRDLAGPVPGEVLTGGNKGAEIFAARRGLQAVWDIRGTIVLGLVVVKVALAYIPRIANDLVWGWERDGYVDAGGEAVTCAREIQMLHRVCLDLERSGIAVKFWLDSRDAPMNREANRLAWSAIDTKL